MFKALKKCEVENSLFDWGMLTDFNELRVPTADRDALVEN